MKETNMEHYRGEIEEAGYRFGIADGKIFACNKGKCGMRCEFFGGFCNANRIKWLMSEYKPEPVLTAREKHFAEFVQTGYIARDENMFLHWFEEKPKAKGSDYWVRSGVCTKISSYATGLFPFITWEDEEPWAVEELRKLKVKE